MAAEHGEDDMTAAGTASARIATGPKRWVLFAVGWIAVALGALGVVLPVMPTVPFLLVAVWAFARSSQRWHDWLYTRPYFGRLLREWDRHRSIPPWAKALAVNAKIHASGTISRIFGSH
jgi:uncharacterized membrane protein YbaN (DUF454 family)